MSGYAEVHTVQWLVVLNVFDQIILFQLASR